MWEWARERLDRGKYVNVMLRCEGCGRCYAIDRRVFMLHSICPECREIMFLKDACTYPDVLEELTYAGRYGYVK